MFVSKVLLCLWIPWIAQHNVRIYALQIKYSASLQLQNVCYSTNTGCENRLRKEGSPSDCALMLAFSAQTSPDKLILLFCGALACTLSVAMTLPKVNTDVQK